MRYLPLLLLNAALFIAAATPLYDTATAEPAATGHPLPPVPHKPPRYPPSALSLPLAVNGALIRPASARVSKTCTRRARPTPTTRQRENSRQLPSGALQGQGPRNGQRRGCRAQGKMRRQRNPNPDENPAENAGKPAPEQQPLGYAVPHARIVSNPGPGGAADKASRDGASTNAPCAPHAVCRMRSTNATT